LPDTQALDWVKEGTGKFGLFDWYHEQAEKQRKPGPSKGVTKHLPHWKRSFNPYWWVRMSQGISANNSWLFRPESFTENSLQYLAGAALW